MHYKSGLLLLGFLCGIAVAIPSLALGTPDSLETRYQEGVAAYQEQRPVRARRLLRAVFEADRSFVRKQGSVAYWLSQAYRVSGRADSSAWVLREGTRALLKERRFDARLFDARLGQMQDADPAVSSRAAELYLQILGRAGSDLAPSSRSVVRKHVAQLAPLLSRQQLLEHVIRDDDLRPKTWTFQDGAGMWLRSWWRRRDHIPTTQVNERLRKHIRRVAAATERFGTGGRAVGWDDQGEIYVRYGPPDRRDRVKFHDVGFLKEVVRSGVGVQYSDFPNNEIWSYGSISGEGAYLFFRTKKDGNYKLGTVMDLLPRTLRGPFGPGDRQQNVAYSAMAALRYVYTQLPRFYDDKSSVLSQLNGWFSYQEARRSLGASGGRKIGFGPGARRVFGGTGPTQGYPSSAATGTIRNVNHQERQLARRRDKEMPREYVSSDRPPFDPEVQYRVARFLDGNGATRTEVYWGERFASDTMEARRLTVSAFRYDERYRQRAKQTETHVLSPEVHSRTGKTHRITLPGEEDLAGQDSYHVAVQWDLYPDSGGVSREKETGSVKSQVGRIDSLRALRAVSSQLEMSDLRLMSAPPGAQEEKISSLQKVVPYPYDTVTTETPLFLYFELYHLGRTNQGQTRYTVTYEARRQTRKGFLGRLFGDDTQTEVTSTTAEYTGRKRRTEEYLQLDLETDPKRPQPTQVTVRVTDNVTGNEIERSLALTLTPSEGGR